MAVVKKLAGLFAMMATVFVGGGTAFAGIGKAESWQLMLQQAFSPVMHEIHDFHDLLLVIIISISVFVLALLLYVMFRFSAKRNPVPSKASHNTLIEVIWTAVPIMILVIIAIPSFKLLYLEDDVADSEMTIEATGYQWYWGYKYPDHGGFEFDTIMKTDDELDDDELRLLTTDNALVVPVDTKVRILVTGADVIHSWAMPSLGVKIDAIPGRLNENWLQVTETGVYYGQCSELCGKDHGFMPIMLRAVTKEEFAAWVEEAKEEFAEAGEPTIKVAEALAPSAK